MAYVDRRTRRASVATKSIAMKSTRECQQGEWLTGPGETGGRATASRIPQGVVSPPGKFQTESGAPYCAEFSGVIGVDTTTGGVYRRNLIVPIINCLAQTALGNIGAAGATAATPVAAFGKFFLTQPYSALKDGNLYGEITGLAGPTDNVKIFNLVQLYR